jgi:hypothetical protein
VTVPADAVADVPPAADRSRPERVGPPPWRPHRRAAGDRSRPVLSVALRPVWRGRHSLQLGVDPARALVVDGIDEATARALLGLDGTRTETEVLADAAGGGLDPVALGRLIDELRAGGALADAPPRPAAAGFGVRTAAGVPAGVPAAARLAPDRAALSLLAGGEGAAEALLARRRAAVVVVHAADRVGAPLAALLAAAGVGHVHVVDRGSVRPADLAPGGLAASELHRSRAAAACDAVRRAAPEVTTGPVEPGRLPDLVVLGSVRPVEEDLRAVLQNAGLPHLPVGIRETTAIVGPLVLPGRTPCLRCTDLHRAERDPAWPLLAAQLTDDRYRRLEPCDVVLATLAAAVGTLQCLAYLDGGAPASLGGTLELALPDWRLRRRSWPPHRHCGCGARSEPAREP